MLCYVVLYCFLLCCVVFFNCVLRAVVGPCSAQLAVASHDFVGGAAVTTPDLTVKAVVVSATVTTSNHLAVTSSAAHDNAAGTDATADTYHGCGGAPGITFHPVVLGGEPALPARPVSDSTLPTSESSCPPSSSVSSSSSSCCSYICTTSTVPGKFHPQRATALGVPKGPLFGKLSRNESVTLPSGVVVTPSQVKDPDCPGSAFAVVACPAAEFLGPLLAARDWEMYYTDGSGSLVSDSESSSGDRFRCMVHLGARDVVLAPEYVAWMQRFGDGVEHILVGTAAGIS